MSFIRKAIFCLLLLISTALPFSLDSLFEPIMKPFDFLPDYYTRFDLSTFALHKNAFFKRQYLAEPHPELEFRLISYKNLASVWQADFLFGLGSVPGDNVFSVLNVAFGINPGLELKLKDATLIGGIAHRCFHEIDRSDFPIVYYNKLFLTATSPNGRLNDYFHDLVKDSLFSIPNRIGWDVHAGYYLKEFFGLASPDKLDGHNPLIWETSANFRYAFHRRLSWIFTVKAESTIGNYSRLNGYTTSNASNWFWKQGIGAEAFFIRGSRGMCLYVTYHLDDLPREPDAPAFTLGNSRFSKNGLAQIGLIFLN